MFLKSIYYQTLLVTVALIWGYGFVLQKQATLLLDPFVFNCLKFLLSASLMLILVYFSGQIKAIFNKATINSGLILGLLLMSGNAFQQIGIAYTTVANSGFITTLYVIIIPIIMHLFGYKITTTNWIAAILATLGLYIISGANASQTQFGDFLQLLGAVCWAGHVTYLGVAIKNKSALVLSFWQTFICGVTSAVWIPFTLPNSGPQMILESWWILFFSGCVSMGLALGLQVIAQRHIKPNNAAIILSLEGLFAAFFGWLFLQEIIGTNTLIGGLLITVSAVISQIRFRRAKAYF